MQHNMPMAVEKQLSPQMIFDITIHGILLWASMGLLMPLGILTIRISNNVKCQRKLKVLFYLHILLQFLAVVFATAGAVMSIKKFENSFDNNHKRVGLALYVAIWIQVILGFCRRNRGSKGRSVWYVLHWVLGTVTSLVGIIDIYTGLQAYHRKTSKSISLWTMLFSAQLCVLAFLYLFQDKWEYLQRQQGLLVLGSELITHSHQLGPQRSSQSKLLPHLPYHKTNALGNYFNS